MTREQRKRAKVARRRHRTERMRVTPARVNVLEDGSSVLIARKVRGPRRGRMPRALEQARLMGIGERLILGIEEDHVERRGFFQSFARKTDSGGS